MKIVLVQKLLITDEKGQSSLNWKVGDSFELEFGEEIILLRFLVLLWESDRKGKTIKNELTEASTVAFMNLKYKAKPFRNYSNY